ncbi:hypothetical protein [uncultured Serinicoccus sp.]|uniref:hypothetical protein n=1 Tax=uncultured Serinicoccus sp. TaxID=735514 RepID=UPI00260DB474|nr:hypothetical protein [uncultured Serinicoccus sp.]
MKFSRITAAATLSSALVLAACSGDDTGGDATTDAAGGNSSATADDAASTDDAGSGTADATGQTVEMTTDAETAALPLDEAEEVATEVLTQRVRADQGDGDDIEEAQEASMAGSVLRAHRAADRLEPVTGEPAEVDLEETPVEPNVLAISREDDQDAAYLLVQTVPEDGAPVLHLLSSESGESGDFRITWEAPMLPDTQVPTFDPRSEGSPVLRGDQGDLTMQPRELLRSVGAYTEWPQPDEVPDYRTHGYAPSVRQAAEDQADALSGQASLREKNWLVSDDVVTLLFEDGSGFVMGSLLRDTQFVVNQGSELTTPEEFRVFQDSEVLTEQATLRTSVFVGMRAPSEDVDFKPEMLAATEQLVDASGE